MSELDPVEQKFIADVEPYIEAVESAARDARDFADANLEATAGLDDVRDHAAEAAAAMGHYRDEVDRARDGSAEFVGAAEAEAAALGHVRDEALAAAEAEKRVADDTSTVRSKFDSLVNWVKKISGGGKDGGIFGKIWGGIPGGGEGGSGLGVLGNLSGLAAGGAGLAAAIGAVLVELDGLVSGFAAAGAGAGAFGLLALPAFHAISGAYTKIKTDQLAYNDALTAAAKNTALKKLHQDYAALDPAERGALKGIQNLMDSYHQMAKEFEPDVFKVFNQGLKIANELLPHLKPFADTFANALDGLLKQVSKFAGSTGFKDWLAQFQKLEGPSITAIGHGIGQVAIAIGKLLTIMSKKDVVNAINIAFSVLAGTVDFLGYVIRRVMLRFDQWMALFHQVASAFDRMRHDVADLAHNVAAHFDEMRHDVADWGHNIASIFDEVRANIHRWADDVGHDVTTVVAWFRALPGRILAVLASLPGRMMALGRAIIEGLLNGIKAAAGGLLGYAEGLAHKISGVFASALHMFSPSRVFHDHGVNIIQGLLNGIRSKAPELLALIRDLGGQTGTGFAGAAGGSTAGTAPSVHVTVPVTLGAGAGGYNSPQFLHYLQGVVQEAVLRYTQVNPSNGLGLAGKIS